MIGDNTTAAPIVIIVDICGTGGGDVVDIVEATFIAAASAAYLVLVAG